MPCLSKLQRAFKDIEEEEETIRIIALAYLYVKRKRCRTHRWWVHDLLRSRKSYGAYHHLVQELDLDSVNFHQYFRLTREQFMHVLSHVEPDLEKLNVTREVISPRERLAICLRFLATGESYKSIAFNYRVGASTVRKIVPEVCEVLWDCLVNLYMPLPKTSDDWKLIAENFNTLWNFPHCIGAVDGKHVVLKAPDNSGSMYYNYKNTFSIVLMALVDSNLKFIYIDIGSYGKNSDGGIFAHSSLGRALSEGQLNLPPDSPLPGAAHLGPLPYVFVGDEAFPLQRHLMRPYPGKGCPERQQMFNYRLSRARRIVENAFGILAARWRIYHTKMAVKPETVKSVVKATCVLHNMLQMSSTPMQIHALQPDNSDIACEGLHDLPGLGNRPGLEAVHIRDIFKDYFADINILPWQYDYVRRGNFNV